jgi:carboxyl-terminal processing protease
MRILKKNFKVLFLAVFVAVASCSFTTKEFNDSDRDKRLLNVITYVLENGHYEPRAIDDAFSKEVYNNFINGLDPLKRYFIASDIEEFSQYENQIDDQIKAKDLSFFDLVYERMLERMEDVKKIYPEILQHPFDYSKNDVMNVDYEALEFAESKEALKDRWRMQLKFTTLSSYYDLVESQKNEKKGDETEDDENDLDKEQKDVKLTAKKKQEPKEPKTLKELEAEARESTLKSLDEYFDFAEDLERKDYFAMYLNTIVEGFDPHTNYFAPPDKDRFDLQMSGKLEGIGARLQKKNDYITVVEVISGGPAWRSEKIEVGDAIMRVLQEGEEDAVSVVGMRLDDAVKLIKGPKGTKVTLTIKSVDGTISDKTIVRDVVELEETYAKSSLIIQEDQRFGVINLPQFYFDMQDYKQRNAASDVKKEILRLKEEGMEGLVIDLRNNGGGSLRTAIDIAGFFIEKGPIVQVASPGNKRVLRDTSNDIVWDGPLVILVNELSASASEILAAAMQDYKRAVVIGSKQTYGKGTVQNLVDLNEMVRNSDMDDLGALKITSQKFYRVNGGSTQLEGVKSDVVMPDRYSYIDVGEKDYNNPMPYDKISPAKFNVWKNPIDVETIVAQSKERIEKNESLQLIDENAKWIKKRRDEKSVNLNYDTYVQNIERRKDETEKFKAIDKYNNNLKFESLPYEVALMETDSTLLEKRNRWHKNLEKDVYVEEAVFVLQDLMKVKNKEINLVDRKN